MTTRGIKKRMGVHFLQLLSEVCILEGVSINLKNNCFYALGVAEEVSF